MLLLGIGSILCNYIQMSCPHGRNRYVFKYGHEFKSHITLSRQNYMNERAHPERFFVHC